MIFYKEVVVSFIVMMVFLSGCLGQQEPKSQESTNNPVPTQTSIPSPPLSSTATQSPTETPTPAQSPITTPPGFQESFTIAKAIAGEPLSIDPAFEWESTGIEVMQNVYENLVWYDGSDITKVVPWLAESYKISPDGLTYTFYLRRGIKFHDGTDFNADAAVYSLRRAMDMELDPTWISKNYADSSGIKKIDDYTLSISTKIPFAGFLYVLAAPVASMMSPKAVEEHGGIVKGRRSDWMDRHAVGTGPFRFHSWVPKKQIELVRNNNYWGGPKGTGLAKSEKVTLRIVEDEKSRVNLLRSGEVDFAQISPEYVSEFKQQKDFIIETFGNSACISYIAFNYDFSIFQDKDVRAAIAHAVDYSSITNKIMKGWAVRARGPIPQSFFGHNPGLYMYDYNMQKAREYLAKSKYPDGFRIITAYNKENDTRKQIVLHIKEQLAKLNIEVEVLEFDNPTYIKKLRAGEFPIYVQGWCPDFADPDDYIFHFFHSQGFFNKTRKGVYSNPDMDRLVESAQRELDPVKRKELYFEIQKKIMDEYLFVWTHFAKNYVIRRNTIKNIVYNNMFDGFWYYTMVKI